MRIIKIIETTIEILSPIELFSDPNNLLKLLKHKYEKKCLKNMLIQTVLSIKDESPCEISPITKTGKMNVKFEVEGIEYAEAEIIHNAEIVNKDATRGSVIAVAPHTYMLITGDRTAESVLAVKQIIPVVNEKSCYRINSEYISTIGKMFTPGQYHSRRYNLYYADGNVPPNELDIYVKKDLQQIELLEEEIGDLVNIPDVAPNAKNPDKKTSSQQKSYDTLRAKLWPCKRSKESCLNEMAGKEKGPANELSLNGAKLVSIKSIVSNSKLQGWYVADDRFIYDGTVLLYDEAAVKNYEQYLSGLVVSNTAITQPTQPTQITLQQTLQKAASNPNPQQPSIRSITTPQLSRYNFITDIGSKEVILALVNSYKNALYNLREFHKTYFEQKTNTAGLWEIFEASKK